MFDGPDHADSFGAVMGPFLCQTCRDGFVPAASPLCPVCGEVFRSREGEDHLCEPCFHSPKKFKKARAVGVYDFGLLEAVHCLKYKGRTELARPLGKLLLECFQKHWPDNDIDIVAPVPLHPKRRRNRGFNQSYLLIRSWPEDSKADGPGLNGVRIAPDLMMRAKPTPPQTGLGRAERMKNLKGAFVISEPDMVKDRRLLLVDDVYTTGATAEACTRVLLKAGAARVDVLTLARTMGK